MSGGGQAPQAYVPPNQGGVANALQGAGSTLTNLGATVQGTAIPGYQSIYNAITSNPYYAGAQAAANKTGQTGTAFGNQEVSSGTGLMSLAGSLGQYAPSIISTAFDPQGSLYGTQQNLNTQQTNAIDAMNGVAGTPYGSGLAALSNQTFNQNWMDTAQTRQLAGIQGLEGLASTQSALTTAGGDLGTSGLTNLTTAGNAATTAYNTQQNYINNALDSLVQGDVTAGTPDVQAGSIYDAYLGIGQQAAATNVAAFQATQAANQAMFSGLGKLLGLGVGAFLPI